MATKLECAVCGIDGKEKGKIELNPGIFAVPVKRQIVAEVIRWQLAKRRAGTHSTLTRSEVRGTTKKCKPQKEQGTRHGDKRAPIFRKGGIVFGPKPRSYEYSLNKKLKTLGLKIALSSKAETNLLKVLDTVTMKTHKTSELKQVFQKLGLENVLIVSDSFSAETQGDNFKKAASNLKGVSLLPVAGLNVYDILKYKNLVITKAGLEALENRFKSN